MKNIYKFSINQEKEVEKQVTKTDSEGKEFKVAEKVKEKVPRFFCIKKPNRALYDDADVYYAAQVSDFIKRGVLSAVQLNKRYLDDGGVLSSEQKEKYAALYTDFAMKKNEYDKLYATAEKTEEDNKKINILLNDLVEIMNEIQGVEEAKNTVLNNTAEVLARDRVITWWMLHLAYEELGENNHKSIFGDGPFEDKKKEYDKMDEREIDFEYELVRKLLLVTGLWYMGKAEKQEDFDVLLKISDNQELLESKEIIEDITKSTAENG